MDNKKNNIFEHKYDHIIKEDLMNFSPENASITDSLEFKKKTEAFILSQINNHIGKTSEKDQLRREYLYNFISMLLLEHQKKYRNTDIRVEGRFKSNRSSMKKIINRAFKQEFEKPITDLFAIKIIVTNSKASFPSTSILSQEKLKNLKILNQLLEFKDKYFCSNDLELFNNLSCEEYFDNLLLLLESIKSTLPENAINLINLYDSKAKIVKQRKDYISIRENKNVTSEDLHIRDKAFEDTDKEKSDFEYLLEDFESRIDDKIFFQILSNQFNTMFSYDEDSKKFINSEYLEKFGVKILNKKTKETKNGYVAKFITLDTVAGKIEIQLQTERQYKDGVSGYLQAHTNYKFNPPPPQLPTDYSNESEINRYRREINPILPEYFKANMNQNSIEPEVSIYSINEYSALKELYQLPANNHLRNVVNKYLEQVRKNNGKIFNKKDLFSQNYQIEDVDEYLTSPNFSKLRDLMNVQESNLDDNNELSK